LGAGDIGPVVYAVKLGFQYRAQDEAFAGTPMGSEITAGAALGLRVADKQLVLGPEIYGSSVVTSSDAFLKKRATPFEAIFGAYYTIDSFRIGAAAGPGLTRGFGTAEMRVLGSLAFAQAVPPPP